MVGYRPIVEGRVRTYGVSRGGGGGSGVDQHVIAGI